MAPELIEEALKRAVLQEKRNFAYIKSILANWRQSGYNTLAQVQENDVKPAAKAKIKAAAATGKSAKAKSKKSQYNEIYDKY